MYLSWYFLFESPSVKKRVDVDLMLVNFSFYYYHFTCLLCSVHLCFLCLNFFLTLKATSSGSLESLPLFGQFSSPSIPSLRYLASQSDVHDLHLCNPFATRAGIIPSPLAL
jgi:hypothetical protein